jgi:hypothetical protein
LHRWTSPLCFRSTKYPDTVLLHGIAERRRTHRRVSQFVFKGRLDAPWQGGALQARRLSMLDVLPIGVFGFADTCIQENLAGKAKKSSLSAFASSAGKGRHNRLLFSARSKAKPVAAAPAK